MKTPTFLFLLLLLPLPSLAADLVDRVVAVVNQDILLWSELEDAIRPILPQIEAPTEEERLSQTAEIRARLLDRLVDEKIVEQAMARADVTVEDKEVEQAMADVARQNRIDLDSLEAELAKQGMGMTEYREELKTQIRQYKFMNLQIRSRVHVDEQALLARWREKKATTAPDPSWHLHRIFLAFPPAADETTLARIDQEAVLLLAQLQGGEDFASKARTRSDDVTTKNQGGDAGLVREADLAEVFAGPLQVAGVGPVVRVDTSKGVFLLQISEVVDAAVPAFDKIRGDLANELYEEGMAREMERWTKEERSKAHVELLP